MCARSFSGRPEAASGEPSADSVTSHRPLDCGVGPEDVAAAGGHHRFGHFCCDGTSFGFVIERASSSASQAS